MICPICQHEYKSVRAGCPNCGPQRAARHSPSTQSPPLPDDDMRAGRNGDTFTQYYREPIPTPPADRAGRRAAPAVSGGMEAIMATGMAGGRSGASGGSAVQGKRGGHSVPPKPGQQQAQTMERPGRVYGAGDVPNGPVYVRKPQERPMRASVQRKVSLGRKGPRVAVIILCVFAVLLTAIGTAGYLLTQTDQGKMLMAVWNWSSAPNEAVWSLGVAHMNKGLLEEAIEAFEKAKAADEASGTEPNINGILELARVYEGTGQVDKAVALYDYLMNTEGLPPRVEPYERMARIYREKEQHQEAIAMMEKGLEVTEAESFADSIKEYAPDPPYASVIGQRSNKDVRVTIRYEEGTVVQFTIDDAPAPASAPDPEAPIVEDMKDPIKYGEVYEGQELVFTEGTTRLRAVALRNGVPSKEMDEVYTVQYPTPSAPKANYAPNEYDFQPNVSIKGENSNIVEIHYTIDGTPATPTSPLYTGPVKLPVGKSTLRAVAIDRRGKVSYEMVVSYEVKGTPKRMFRKEDQFEKLTLMKTTYEQFVRAYGEPSNFEQIEIGAEEELFRADYDFGYACFVQIDAAGKKVLYELSMETDAISGPRKLSVGDSEGAVIEAFRDMGGQANERGERVLYKSDVEGNLGTYTLEADGNYAAHYYYPRDKNDYVELSFYFQNDKVVRMHWLRYVGDT